MGGARQADPPTPRGGEVRARGAGRAPGRGRWRLRLDGDPAGARRRCRRTSTEPLGTHRRYQTVYAAASGSAAAPTAGLHFTPELLGRLDLERVTLHVGLDTFRPLAVDRVEDHALHGERYEVAPGSWERIRSARRVLAVGTTTVRVLETFRCARPSPARDPVHHAGSSSGASTVLTNFHLPARPCSPAWRSPESTDRRLYRIAIEERYRFYRSATRCWSSERRGLTPPRASRRGSRLPAL